MSQLNVNQVETDEDWLTSSVKDFFSGVNWENVTAPSPMLPTMIAGERNLNPNMTVGEFFGVIPWDGTLAIAAPPPSLDLFDQELGTTEDELTLDDFFGSF